MCSPIISLIYIIFGSGVYYYYLGEGARNDLLFWYYVRDYHYVSYYDISTFLGKEYCISKGENKK